MGFQDLDHVTPCMDLGPETLFGGFHDLGPETPYMGFQGLGPVYRTAQISPGLSLRLIIPYVGRKVLGVE